MPRWFALFPVVELLLLRFSPGEPGGQEACRGDAKKGEVRFWRQPARAGHSPVNGKMYPWLPAPGGGPPNSVHFDLFPVGILNPEGENVTGLRVIPLNDLTQKESKTEMRKPESSFGSGISETLTLWLNLPKKTTN